MPDESLYERITELEIRLTHQESLCQDLNQIVADQQRALIELERRIEDMRLRLLETLASAPMADPSQEPPPPHY